MSGKPGAECPVEASLSVTAEHAVVVAMFLVVAQGFRRALLSLAAPLLAPLHALGGLAGAAGAPRSSASALVLLAALLVAPLAAPVAPPTPSATLAAVSGLLRKVRSGLSTAVIGAPARMASSAIARTVVLALEQLVRFLPPVNDNVTSVRTLSSVCDCGVDGS